MDDLGVPLFLETSKLQNPGEIPRIEATTWEIRRGRNSDSGNDHGKQTENNESGSGKKNRWKMTMPLCTTTNHIY